MTPPNLQPSESKRCPMTHQTTALVLSLLLAITLSNTSAAAPSEQAAGPRIHLAAASDPMLEIRRDQWWPEVENAIKSGNYKRALVYIRKLDALGVELPAEYPYYKAKALLETGDAAGAQEQVMLYLSKAGSAGQFYREALNLLTATESAAKAGTIIQDCTVCPEMVVIPAGSFQMGSNGGSSDEKPVHTVNVPTFALAKTEVTFAQWDACVADRGCNGYYPEDKNWGRGRRPVIYVNWNDAQAYVHWLSRKTGQQYRLPSEAEWEYACRAGGTQEYCGSDSLDSVAWYDGNSGSKTHPVAGKEANAWGLYDMSGNVWEWVQDCYNDSYTGAPTDGSAWTSGNCGRRVLRGGSWCDDPTNSRAAGRGWNGTAGRDYDSGFRPARIVSP